MSEKFAATAPTLGYLFQIRLALLFLLRSDRDRDLAIEALDDIQFEKNGSSRELIQTKHHVAPGNITNAGTDLWKTIRVWATQVSDASVDLKDIAFTLITTSTATPGSIAAYLLPSGPGAQRSPTKALELMRQVASTSGNLTNKSSYEAFKNLSPELQYELVSLITVIDGSPNITDSIEDIRSELDFTTRPQFLNDLTERLEGWWFGRVVRHLTEASRQRILHRELLAQINDLQEQYHSDNLPIHYSDFVGPEEQNLNENERVFIEQLRLIIVTEPRIQKAITDYFRAYQQRSKWLREGHLLIGDLEAYEGKLIDEWERLFEAEHQELAMEDSEVEKKKSGRALFRAIQERANLHIKPRCTEPYVMRGTYHLLSNQG
ncbi:MAG: hypothetical protein EOP09_02630, partial [Proteobacteria bacterium]